MRRQQLYRFAVEDVDFSIEALGIVIDLSYGLMTFALLAVTKLCKKI